MPTRPPAPFHADPPPSAALAPFLERARALAPLLEAEAEASEAAETLTPKSVEALRDADLMRAFLPKELGGAERPATELVALVEEIARQDGSAGWCFGMNALVGGICAAALPDEGIEQVFGPAPERVLIAGGFPPQGRAERDGVDGAGRPQWRVSGDMRFGSGIRHADFVACTTVEMEGEAPVMDGAIPRMRTFVVPREGVRIAPNWQVAGLGGTGSCDYHLEDARLPDALSFVSSTLAPKRGHDLYRLPLLSLAGAPHAGFALGVGRRALEEIREQAEGRQRLGSASPLLERATFQQGYARTTTGLRAARALVMQSFGALAAAAQTPRGATLADRAAASAATTHAYECAHAAADFAFRAAGGPALFRTNRLQRCLRDIQAGRQHIVADDESWERVGQVWLGVGEPRMV